MGVRAHIIIARRVKFIAAAGTCIYIYICIYVLLSKVNIYIQCMTSIVITSCSSGPTIT